MNETTTAATDYLLALLAAVLGVRLLLIRTGRWRKEEVVIAVARRLWAGSFLALAVAAALGGTWHALAPETVLGMREHVWSATYVAAGVANLLMLAGVARAALPDGIRTAAVGGAAVVLLLCTALTLWRRDVVLLGCCFALTQLLLLAFGIALRQYREGAAGFMIAGALVALAGGLVLLLRVGPHPRFNHNDLFHVIEMAGLGLLYKAGLELRDR